MNAEREVHEDDLSPEQLDEMYGHHANEVGVRRESFRDEDRRLGRVPVRDDEELDTALIDLQFGNAAQCKEFERRLQEAER